MAGTGSGVHPLPYNAGPGVLNSPAIGRFHTFNWPVLRFLFAGFALSLAEFLAGREEMLGDESQQHACAPHQGSKIRPACLRVGF